MASKKRNILKRKSDDGGKKNNDLPPPRALKEHELYDLVAASKIPCCARGKKFGCILEGLALLKGDDVIICHQDAVHLFAECRREVLLKTNEEKEQFVKDKVKVQLTTLVMYWGKFIPKSLLKMMLSIFV